MQGRKRRLGDPQPVALQQPDGLLGHAGRCSFVISEEPQVGDHWHRRYFVHRPKNGPLLYVKGPWPCEFPPLITLSFKSKILI